VLEWLRAADHRLFHLLNAVWTHPWLDAFLPVATDLHKVKPFLLGGVPVAFAWWFHARRMEAVKGVLVAALAVGLADNVNHRLIKPAFARSRPSKAGISVVMRTPQHYGYSFPSNHAANTAAAAYVLRAVSPGLAAAALLVAVVISYSRVYVGVHFPADVLAGALVGCACGWLVLWALRRLKLLKG
jgi:undecaprenyl-diphosphatase